MEKNNKGLKMKFSDYNNYFIDILNLVDISEVELLITNILKAYENNKNIFVIGNGGSAANASHFAQDLAKGTRKNINTLKRIKALSLTDNVPFITALGNDDGYDTIFEQQLRTFANSGDYLIAISGSGNSPNIIKAVEWANNNNIITIGITGFDGGVLKKINKYSVRVSKNDMCTIESIHSHIFHYVIIEINKRINEMKEIT